VPRQLTFELPARPALGRGDFFVSDANRLAAFAIEGWRAWPGGKLVLTGPEGAGKTHLAHVWAAEAAARLHPAQGLATADIPTLAQGPVAIEDADRRLSDADEAAFFHLHNLALAEGHALLVTATRPPGRWPLALADLKSRMQGCTVATLEPPDDALLAAVLVKLFADRQLAVAPALIGYLAKRIDRSFAAAGRIVAALDRAALAEARPITRALAARVLDNPEPGAR